MSDFAAEFLQQEVDALNRQMSNFKGLIRNMIVDLEDTNDLDRLIADLRQMIGDDGHD